MVMAARHVDLRADHDIARLRAQFLLGVMTARLRRQDDAAPGRPAAAPGLRHAPELVARGLPFTVVQGARDVFLPDGPQGRHVGRQHGGAQLECRHDVDRSVDVRCPRAAAELHEHDEPEQRHQDGAPTDREAEDQLDPTLEGHLEDPQWVNGEDIDQEIRQDILLSPFCVNRLAAW